LSCAFPNTLPGKPMGKTPATRRFLRFASISLSCMLSYAQAACLAGRRTPRPIRAEMYAKAGDRKKAIGNYIKAVQPNPDNKAGKAGLEKLQAQG
jgi:hypothetical protein